MSNAFQLWSVLEIACKLWRLCCWYLLWCVCVQEPCDGHHPAARSAHSPRCGFCRSLRLRFKTWLWLSKPFLDPILGVGEFTAHFRTYFSGVWDVHWGCGLWILNHGHLAFLPELSPVSGLSSLEAMPHSLSKTTVGRKNKKSQVST